MKFLEWFDENRKFNFNPWIPEDGYIEKSTRFDGRNKNNPIAFTSLIVDAAKY